MKNIELKLKIESFETLLPKIQREAKFTGTLHQTDTYFLLGSKRLKVREEENKSELIYYVRKNTENSKDSVYYVFRLNRRFVSFAKKALGAIFGTKKIVKKRRDLYLYENTRIHIDTVKDFGNFLELETVVKDEKQYADFAKEQERIISLLGLREYQKISCSYSDMG